MSSQDPGSSSSDLAQRAMVIDSGASTNSKLRGRDDDDDALEGCKRTRSTGPPTARPTIAFMQPVVLFARQYPAFIAAANPPAPTPTSLVGGLVSDRGVYPGDGSLALIAGNAAFFTDVACTNPLVDPNDQLPLTQAHAVRIPNAALANFVLYVRGHAAGPLTVQLTLDAAEGWLIGGAATDTATVVQLTLEASPFAPNAPARVLTDAQKIVYGKYVGVPPAHAVSLRAPIRIRAGNPQGHGLLLLQIPGGGVVVHTHQWNNTGNVIAVAQNDADQTLWIEGTQVVAPFWLSLHLELPNGSQLQHGDVLKVVPVAQAQISVGYEWETPQVLVERRHDNAVLRGEAQWEGCVSKGIVFSSAHANVQIDTEVTTGAQPYSYAEMVLGPAYDHAQLEAQFGELLRIEAAVRARNPLYVQTPAPIHYRIPGRYHEVWMPANHLVALAKTEGMLRGTAQSTFAVPLWMLPTFLSILGGAEGRAAKAEADRFAAFTADDLANNPNRDAGDLVTGLIAACEYYIETFRGCAHIADDDGPKTALPVMFRTDFHAMYQLLQTNAQRDAFAAWRAAHPHTNAVLLPNGHGQYGAGPTVDAWLASVIQPPVEPAHIALPGGAQYAVPASLLAKDLLSPPPGLPRHCRIDPIKYGMGKMKTDGATGHVIAECRSYMGGDKGLQAFIAKAFEFANECLLAGAPTWVRGEIWGWGPPGYGGTVPNIDGQGVLPP